MKVRVCGLDNADKTAELNLESEAGQLSAIFATIILNMRLRLAEEARPTFSSRAADLDPHVPMSAVRSMEQLSSAAIAQPRLYLILIASFAGTAVLLAVIGLYGVLAYAVGQRTREIGIRLALGAKRAEVLRMVMTQAGRLAITGVAIGLGAAVLASRALRSQLFEIAPTDSVTYAMVGVGLLISRSRPAGFPRGAHRELIRSQRSVMIEGWRPPLMASTGPLRSLPMHACSCRCRCASGRSA